MSNEILKQEIEKDLRGMGLLDEDLVDAVICVAFLREKLEPVVRELEGKSLPASIAIANDQDAIAAVDEITERVVNRQGLLEKAMMGEDIHDTLASIKAKIESLIVGSEVAARTIEQMQEATKKMRTTNRNKIKD
ncbi:hypothetical protein [Candidatus Uabimicrobium amorphum]|uniref:Uncharacterized protein n=1 Tax=Uabimicrobium amorphum TaxID=2596890 RepID=A0A5S9F162_UABAM|nr:hypothetical protein [Candidatus Uabimicrobium amorphum]BBM82325.1 hypothetical protein UABAM_00668 [Candidatus Uabimicrobium amorphum]